MKSAQRALVSLSISGLLTACGTSPQAVQPGPSNVAGQSSQAVAPAGENITVTVTDTDENPISNAVISAAGTSVTAQTDSAGHAYLMGLSPGDYKVQVEANGYFSDATEARAGGLDVHFRLHWAPPAGTFVYKDSAYLVWVVLTVHQELSADAVQIWWDCGDHTWHQRALQAGVGAGVTARFAPSTIYDSYELEVRLSGPGQFGSAAVEQSSQGSTPRPAYQSSPPNTSQSPSAPTC